MFKHKNDIVNLHLANITKLEVTSVRAARIIRNAGSVARAGRRWQGYAASGCAHGLVDLGLAYRVRCWFYL